MKVKYLLLSMLAAFALLSCAKEEGSNDDPIKNNPVAEDSESYLSVRISMPGDASTRGDEVYEDATEDEVQVTEVAFLFFNGDNQVAQPYFTTTSSWSDDGTAANSIHKIGDAVAVMKNPTTAPDNLIVILNPGSVKEDLNVSLTMPQLQAIAGNYKSDAFTTAGYYIMSNSVYVDTDADPDSVRVGTPVKSSNFYAVQDSAKNHPVNVYVERPIAKVSLTDNVTDKYTADSTTSQNKIYVNFEGWWLDNEPQTDLLMKPLETSYDYIDAANFGSLGNWNILDDYRSFWATPYNPGTTGFFQHNNWNTHIDWDDLTSYALENTNYNSNPTQVVVAAKLQVADASGNLQDTTIITYMGGNYLKDDFETERRNDFSDYYVGYTKTDGTTTDTLLVKLSDPSLNNPFVFDYDHQNANSDKKYIDTVKVTLGTYPTVPSDYSDYTTPLTDKYFKIVGDKKVDATTELTEKVNAAHWEVYYYNAGRTYYYFQIIRDEDALKTDQALYGVVRNHLYKISITGVKGLGTAVPDDGTVEIIPEKPSDVVTYLAAKINILAYRVVNQSVVLGE